MAHYFSGSGYNLARLCPGSTAQARIGSTNERADSGNAIHQHLDDRVKLGLQAALDLLPQRLHRWELNEDDAAFVTARCRRFTFVPPAGALSEVPLCLVADGSVVSCVGGRGEYEVPEGGVLPATLDVMWSEPEPLKVVDGVPRCPQGSVLWVPDYKSGKEENVAQVEHNRQAMVCALLAAIYTGAARVVPGIVYVRSGEGEWDCPTDAAGNVQPVNVEGLRWLLEEVLATHAACAEQARRRLSGEPLTLVEGTHCGWCAARERCPAKLAMIRAVVDGTLAPSGEPGELTTSQAARLAEVKPQIARWLVRANEALKLHADAHGDVPLGDGRVYGRHEVQQDEVEWSSGLEVLAAEVGEVAAKAALTPPKLARSAIDAALKKHLEESGVRRQGEATKRRVYARLKASGALRKVAVVKYEVHKVEPEKK